MGVGAAAAHCTGYQAGLQVHPSPIPGEQTACRCACAYALHKWLDRFFRGWKPLRLIFFHASGLAPSGGHILSSLAKKEYGKKDAAQGGGGPRPTYPPPWVGVGGAAAHCTSCQADLFLHPSSGLVCKPLAAALALTTQGASLLAAVVRGFLILISSRQACWRPPGLVVLSS